MNYFEMGDTGDYNEHLELLLEEYRDVKAELQPMLTELKNMEKHIKKMAIELGEGAEVEGASVSIRNGYTRTSWDGKALSGYAAAHPEIEQFRKTSEVKAAAVIKVKL